MAHEDQSTPGTRDAGSPGTGDPDTGGLGPDGLGTGDLGTHGPDAGGPGDVPDGESPSERVITGDESVDEALTALADLPDRPVREHVAAFDAVHGALADRLAETQA